MARKFKGTPPTLPDKLSDVTTNSYDIQVVTPMFGGGVKAGENDPSMLIRPMSIRGHLRFWWRAIYGAKNPDTTVQQMRVAEQNIWGSTDSPSKVIVRVHVANIGTTQPCARFPEDRNFPQFELNYPAYALFPFQGKKSRGSIEKEPASATNNIQFSLSIICPNIVDYSKEIEPAIWAWVNFGGIGARTRRGCGTLFCKELAPENANSIQAWFMGKLTQYNIQNKTVDWLTFPKSLYVKNGKPSTPMAAWNDALNQFRDFRQGKDVGRNHGRDKNMPSKLGRSFWPEPDAIRSITEQVNSAHRQAFPNDKTCGNIFPRAEFGLPIITHFQSRQDPKDTELVPVVDGQVKERMGSPLIIKPLALQDGNAISCVLCMNGKRINEVGLRDAGGQRRRHGQFKVQAASAASYQVSPMKNRSQTGSALEAFIAYLKTQQFMEIK